MKNIIKKWWFWVIVIVIAIAIFSSSSKEDTPEGITKLAAVTEIQSSQNVYLDLNSEEEQSKIAYILVECESEFDVNNINLITQSPGIATVSYVSYTTYTYDSPRYRTDMSAYDYELTIQIDGVSAGETNVYAETSDGLIQSDFLNINVTGDANYDKLTALPGSSLADAINLISDCGYTATYKHDDSKLDFTEEITVFSDEEKADKWVIVECEDIDTDNKTIILTINTKENIAENEAQEEMIAELSSKLGPTHAWQAVQAYGREEYPYGFDLHYIMGVLAEEAIDENTWYLKATVTVTNMYNAEQELECEAKVTGTNDNPEVIDFKVY